MKTKLKFFMTGIAFLFAFSTFSQVLISNSAGNPDGSAMLQIDSDTKGILIPRMNTSNREAIAAVPGLIVYDTDEGSFYLYKNNGWVDLSSAEIWSQSTSDVYVTNTTKNVGIGTASPTYKLHVESDNKAIYGYTDGTGPVVLGVYGNSIGSGANKLGVYGVASGVNSNFGVYGYAWGGTVNWAGYFDGNMYAGGQLGINTITPSADLHVVQTAGTLPSIIAETVGIFQQNSGTENYSRIAVIGGTSGVSVLDFGDAETQDVGSILYSHINDFMSFTTNTTEKMRISSSGNLGINTTNPGARLDVRNSGSEDIFNLFDLGTEVFTVVDGGDVGIGIEDPIYKLDIEAGPGDFRAVNVLADRNIGSSVGIYAAASGNTGTFSYDKYGVIGVAEGTGIGNRVGVYGTASGGTTTWAGYFIGDVNITGSVIKSKSATKIDHPLDPENKILYHSSVESPDMKNIYDGNVKIDNKGEAIVILPDYFEALNMDFRYQLTAIGAPGPNLYIKEKIKGNKFIIAGGIEGMEVSWQVTGIRQDAFAKKNRIELEVDKKADEKGKYLHPEVFNQPKEKAIDYEMIKK